MNQSANCALTREVNVGLVGLGRLGQRHAETLFSKISGAKLTAVCSPNETEQEWANDHLRAVEIYHDYSQFLQHAQLEVVILATPTHLHVAQIIQALQYGKHVFCEKPLSLNLDECLKIQTMAEQYSAQKIMIGFVRRFDASYQAAYQAIRSGHYGEPFMVYSQTADQYDSTGFFVKFSETSGGIFLDCAIHDIDLARWFLGNPKPKRVLTSGINALTPELEQYSDVDNGVAIIEFENNKMALFYASRTMPHGHETVTDIMCTQGKLSVGRNPRNNRLEIADIHGWHNQCVMDFYERFAEAFVNELTVFINAVANNQPLPLTLMDAIEATRIGIAMQQSFKTGLPVNL